MVKIPCGEQQKTWWCEATAKKLRMDPMSWSYRSPVHCCCQGYKQQGYKQPQPSSYCSPACLSAVRSSKSFSSWVEMSTPNWSKIVGTKLPGIETSQRNTNTTSPCTWPRLHRLNHPVNNSVKSAMTHCRSWSSQQHQGSKTESWVMKTVIPG